MWVYRAAVNDGGSQTSATGGPNELSAGLAAATAAVTAWAGGSIIAKGIDMGGLAVAVYRFWMFAALISAWMAWRGNPVTTRILRRSMWGGIALGADVAFFFSAIKLTNVVNATLIGSLQPVVVGVVAARFFGESIRGRDALWSAAALAGVVGVVLASSGTPEWSVEGDLLAVAAMFAWSAYFVFSKNSKSHLTSMEYTAGTAIWTAAINTPLAIAFGQDLSVPSATNLFWLAVMVVVAGTIGHLLMNWALVRIPLWVGSTFTLFIPVAASLLAWIFLGESLSLAQVASMALVLVALVVIVRGQATAATNVRPDRGQVSRRLRPG